MSRRPVPERLKKKPSDYPQLAFRVSEADKAKLLREVEAMTKALNRARASDEDHFWTKGDVFVKALYLGFEAMKKR